MFLTIYICFLFNLPIGFFIKRQKTMLKSLATLYKWIYSTVIWQNCTHDRCIATRVVNRDSTADLAKAFSIRPHYIMLPPPWIYYKREWNSTVLIWHRRMCINIHGSCLRFLFYWFTSAINFRQYLQPTCLNNDTVTMIIYKKKRSRQ